MSTQYSGRIVTDGLKIALDAANPKSYSGSGSTWFDLSGNANNCVFVNTPTYNSNGYFTFNGSSHYGAITANSSLNFSAEQTLLIVMRHTYTSGRKNPWNQAYGGYGTWTHEDGGYITGFFGDAGNDNTPYVGPASQTTSTGIWNFACSTRNITQYRWFMNSSIGSPSGHSYGTLTTTSNNITIGAGYAGYWQGDMAMVLAYTRALTSDEVIQNFNAIRSRFGV